MRRFDNYKTAELWLQREICLHPEFITKSTYEIMGTGFVLTNPLNNKNDHSDYEYGEEFFQWVLIGDKNLPEHMIKRNPWIQRFVTATGLPPEFSATYGWKIRMQIDTILSELKMHRDSRRGYCNINIPNDKIILQAKTTHEFPCTIGFQLFIRNEKLHMFVNMRSNNCYSVMPYDVYNFTRLQDHYAERLGIQLGAYYHQIISAHIYKGDVSRLNQLN